MEYINYKQDKSILKLIKPLYLKSFPSDERMPFFMLKRLANKINHNCYAAFDENVFIGMIYTVTYKNIVYLYYLAIDDSIRGKGYGTKILAFLQRLHKNKTIVLTIEALDETQENNDVRIKRKQFYEKNGFFDSFMTVKEFTVTYEILFCGDKFTIDEYEQLMNNVFGKLITKYFVKIKE